MYQQPLLLAYILLGGFGCQFTFLAMKSEKVIAFYAMKLHSEAVQHGSLSLQCHGGAQKAKEWG